MSAANDEQWTALFAEASISSMTSGAWPDDLNTSSHIAIKRALLIWYSNHMSLTSDRATSGADALGRLETFHLAFLHLLARSIFSRLAQCIAHNHSDFQAPFEAIELACGKDGPDVLCDPWLSEQLRLWAATPFARLAILHAGQVWSLLGAHNRQQPGGLLLPTAALHAS